MAEVTGEMGLLGTMGVGLEEGSGEWTAEMGWMDLTVLMKDGWWGLEEDGKDWVWRKGLVGRRGLVVLLLRAIVCLPVCTCAFTLRGVWV